jgi:hypothetical protein
MRFCIATIYNPDYAFICDVTNPNKQRYAARHGYEFIPSVIEISHLDLSFARYGWYTRLLQSNFYDWLFCCDGDMIFTNFTILLNSFVGTDHHFVIAKDALMVQAGVFLVRNSPHGRSILRRISAMQSQFRDGLRDQEAIQVAMSEFPEAFKVLPQRRLQSYEYGLYKDLGGNYLKAQDADGNDGQWQPGDFALHVPGVGEQKLKVLSEHLPLVET